MEKQEFTLQVHYFMKDEECHSFNAITHNECERQLLNYIQAIANITNEKKLELVSDLSEEGGWKDNLKIIASSTLFILVISKSLDHFLSPALDPTEQAKNLVETAKIIKESGFTQEEVAPLISNNEKLEKFSSVFYQRLDKDPNVIKLQTTLTNSENNEKLLNSTIEKKDFAGHITKKQSRTYKKFGTTILIISPLLVEIKRLKWRGKYNGTDISFIMKDNDFITDVHNQKVSFESGTSIQCDLEIKETIKIKNGFETIENHYTVIKVHKWFDGKRAKIDGKDYIAVE
ncbi:hypothetical protein PI172_2282 [Prevotella intermedia]|uniref:Uncharacterized protein n=1 Tax=Prevotella intermedia TaxID=28131 RepID=A0AAD1F879_PREIN|nr:hypothetical protein [Prevotella intermedia]AFJ07643.1 hypothetical protein PIN17_0219 [Prevotella intermedia 17]APW35426.1 hypothetical protein BWX40_11120 [Prevotella intermedia]BAR97010.1 hypothetical protein PI172_2282 [Prevotella intermedia]